MRLKRAKRVSLNCAICYSAKQIAQFRLTRFHADAFSRTRFHASVVQKSPSGKLTRLPAENAVTFTLATGRIVADPEVGPD
jgi:hypothetical protein